MPKLLFKDALKSPGKLLALCFVMYLASLSFFVAGFLVLVAARWLHRTSKQKLKAIETAEAEAEAARIEAERLAAAAQVAQAAKAAATAANVASATGAANDNTAEPVSTPRYAKSAVVLPFNTGTR